MAGQWNHTSIPMVMVQMEFGVNAMKKILLLSAALVALLAGPAMAQRDGGNRGEGPRAGQSQQYPNRSGRDGVRPDANRQRPDFQAQQQRSPAPQMQEFQRDSNRDGRADFRRDNDRGGRLDFRGNNDRRDFGENDRFENDRRSWDNNRPGYSYRPGYDSRRYSQYYRNWNSQSRFRAGVYYRPQGYAYRRWSYGDILPRAFWGSRYWLSNYYSYDLPPPPPGTIWVRYGDDALLIDRYSGEVIQVSYSVFW